MKEGELVVGARGRYRLGLQLAKGASAATFSARREEDGQAVLVKLLRVDGMKDWQTLEHFQREAQVLRHLAHPAIPRCLDEVVMGPAAAPEGFALVQEFVPGEDLARMVRGGHRFDEAAMLRWFEEILQVLDYLHHQHPAVIHRDVNPKNIVVRPDGSAVLVDFGSVQAARNDGQTSAVTSSGTFGFAPMEQFVGRATAASDLYGLGVTFLAVASGLQPEQMPLAGNRLDVRALLKTDKRMRALIEAMTEPDPRVRLGDAALALQRLAAIRSAAGTEVDASGPGSDADVGTVNNLHAYLTLVSGRFRDEGITALPGGELAGRPLVLTGVRTARGLGGGPVHAYFCQATTGVSEGQSLRDLAGDVVRSHARDGDVSSRVLRGESIVIPVIVSDGSRNANPGDLPPPSRRNGVILVPALIDLATGAVRIGRAVGDLGATGRALLPYIWWLLAPRLLARPRMRPVGSLRRIAMTTMVGAIALFAALEAYWAVIGATGTYYLVYAADHRSGTFAAKSYFREGSLAKGWMFSRAPAGPRLRRSLPTDAYLCALEGQTVTYFTVDRSRKETVFWKAPMVDGDPVERLRVPLVNRWASCALRGQRLAIETDEDPSLVKVLIHDGDGPPRPAPGTIAGDHHPVWSNEGDTLVVAHREGEQDTLVAIDLGTGARRALTTAIPGGQHQDIHPAFSPEGKRLAFLRSSRRAYGDTMNRQTSAVFDLSLLDLPSGQVRLLIQNVCLTAAPAWGGAERIFYGKWTDRHCGLFSYDLATDQEQLLENDYEDH